MCVYIYIYMYDNKHYYYMCVYIYIYTYIERERLSWLRGNHLSTPHLPTEIILFCYSASGRARTMNSSCTKGRSRSAIASHGLGGGPQGR